MHKSAVKASHCGEQVTLKKYFAVPLCLEDFHGTVKAIIQGAKPQQAKKQQKGQVAGSIEKKASKANNSLRSKRANLFKHK
eukprot:6207804-Pleurochrysis_carterae.AAC.5